MIKYIYHSWLNDMDLKSYYLFSTFSFLLISINISLAIAQPSWELYENESCAISLMHPYMEDKISQASSGTFQIFITKDNKDPDSLNMNITVSCLDKQLPITEQSMNLTMSGLEQEFELVTYEENSLNETAIDGEKLSFVTVGGQIERGELFNAQTVAEINHENNTYIIRILSAGDDGLSGFFNNHNYLKDNILGSIKFLN